MTHKDNLFLIFGPLNFEKKFVQSFFLKNKMVTISPKKIFIFYFFLFLQNRLGLKSPLKKTALYDSI